MPNNLSLNKVVISNNNYGVSVSPDSVLNVHNNVVSGNNFGAYNYGTTTVDLVNNWWGDASGPKQANTNPNGLGDEISDAISFSPWLLSDPRITPPQLPQEYYAKITNFPGGIASLYQLPDDTSTLVKTLPNDYIVYVASTTDYQNQPVIASGNRWYKVKDPSDNSEMWMPIGLSTGEENYLPYDQSAQTDLHDRSANVLDSNASDIVTARRHIIVEAVDHYFSNASTSKSLYSSDDHTLTLSQLPLAGFPQELILAMIAQEDGPNFNNEIVTYDYGHGVMQVTTDAYAHEAPGHSFIDNINDPLGVASDVHLKKCKENHSDQYKKCYENTNTYNTLTKPYSHYDHINTNPIYKQYVNTSQSIYANIKDGLAVLRSKYGHVYQNPCAGPVLLGGLIFSCDDIKKIKAVWGYNGAVLDPSINYLGLISTKLKNLPTYFPGHSYSDSDQLIEKLAYAGTHRREIKVHSPVKLQVFDTLGHMTGVDMTGNISDNIPNSYYDPDSESALILFPAGPDTYKVIGDGTGGSYGLDIVDDAGTQHTVFQATNIPISAGEIHTYHVNESLLASGKQGVMVDVDQNGDGIPEQTIKTGTTLSTLPPRYTFLSFMPKSFDGGSFKKNKVLPIKFRVKAGNGRLVPLLHPAVSITRIADGFHAKISPNIAGEDPDCEVGDECFVNHHNRYVYRLPAGTLTVGQWKVTVTLDNGQSYSTLINIIN